MWQHLERQRRNCELHPGLGASPDKRLPGTHSSNLQIGLRMNSSPKAQEDELPFLPELSITPNLVSSSGFIYGIEAAYLGNALSAFGNLIAFSIRNRIPVMYPQIMNHAKLFGFKEEDFPFIFHVEPFHPDKDGLRALRYYIETQALENYYPGYMERLRTIPAEWLSHLKSLSSATIFIRYSMNFSDLGVYENTFTRSASRGNILVVPGAYWWQYRDLPTEAAGAVRAALPIVHVDTQQKRLAVMTDKSKNIVKIGVHVRRGDYKDYVGGQFFWELETYINVMKDLSKHLRDISHLFVICSNEVWDLDMLQGIPCIYEQGDTYDDFVALSACDYVVGPPSTFSNWASFLGRNKRLILTPESLAKIDSLGLSQATELAFPTGSGVSGDFWNMP